MAQISQSEAEDLLAKLLSDRTPLIAFFRSPSRAEARISGFMDSITPRNGWVISTSGPPIKDDAGFIRVRPFDEGCVFWYGEKRELPEHLRHLADVFGESTLVVNFPSGEALALFFTV